VPCDLNRHQDASDGRMNFLSLDRLRRPERFAWRWRCVVLRRHRRKYRRLFTQRCGCRRECRPRRGILPTVVIC